MYTKLSKGAYSTMHVCSTMCGCIKSTAHSVYSIFLSTMLLFSGRLESIALSLNFKAGRMKGKNAVPSCGRLLGPLVVHYIGSCLHFSLSTAGRQHSQVIMCSTHIQQIVFAICEACAASKTQAKNFTCVDMKLCMLLSTKGCGREHADQCQKIILLT